MAVSFADRYQALIESSSDTLFLVNGESKIAYASASTAKVPGDKSEELLGRRALDLIYPQDRDHSLRLLKKALEEPQFLHRTEDRMRTGEQLQAESLARSNAELQAFAHTVAHDLREPLRTITAFTQILLQRAQLDQADQEVAQFIVAGAKRMSTLLDDLLASACNGSSDPPHPVELEHSAEQAVQNLREALTSSGASLTIGPLPRVLGNESDLIRVFQNLMGNAVKYRSPAPIEIQVTAQESGPDWVIRVHDNGIGIAKEHHERVFAPFTRLHTQEIPGTGIGLAVCKKIVEGLGGAIWVESEPGAGSTFCFRIEAANEQNSQRGYASMGAAG